MTPEQIAVIKRDIPDIRQLYPNIEEMGEDVFYRYLHNLIDLRQGKKTFSNIPYFSPPILHLQIDERVYPTTGNHNENQTRNT